MRTLFFLALAAALFGGLPTFAEEWQDRVSKVDTQEFEVRGVRKISHEEALEMLANNVKFVDVRRAVQYNLSHIPGSVNLELKTQFDETALQNLITKDDPVVFYCSDKQCYRSAHASAQAAFWGYTNVAYFAGGFTDWIGSGYPTD